MMGKVYAGLDERLRKFIARQPVFFVATAPCLTAGGERVDGQSPAQLAAYRAGKNALSIDGPPALG
jgi:hypothetical protein